MGALGWVELRRGVFAFLKISGDLIIFLDGLLSEISCFQSPNHDICNVVSNPFDFEHMVNNNANANVCFALDKLTAEFFIKGWRIFIATHQTTKSSNSEIEGENFVEHLLHKCPYEAHIINIFLNGWPAAHACT